MTALGATTPAGWAVIGTIAVVGVISIGIKYAKTKQKTKSVVKERKTSPIGRRNTYNSRKKAKEAAKRAGGGKEPRHDPNGHKDDR